MEMVAALVHQLTRNLTTQQIENTPFAAYFVDHTTGVYPTAASGFPWSAGSIQSTGDVIADLTEDLAADGATIQEQHGWKPLKTLDC
jgi:spore coat protein JC